MPHGFSKLIGGGLSGTAGFMGKIGLEPAYPLAVYIGVLELVVVGPLSVDERMGREF